MAKREQQEKKDRKEYFHHYYLERKESLSEKRHGLYHSDSEYRERAKESARVYRKRKKEERDKLRAEGKLPPRKQIGPRKPVSVMINGEKVLAYTITIAARRLHRSVDSISYWTRLGLLPVTPLRSKRGERLYTDAMILVLQMALSKRGKISMGDKSFYREVFAGWTEAGILLVDKLA